jgi:hypothetical protein
MPEPEPVLVDDLIPGDDLVIFRPLEPSIDGRTATERVTFVARVHRHPISSGERLVVLYSAQRAILFTIAARPDDPVSVVDRDDVNRRNRLISALADTHPSSSELTEQQENLNR